MRRPTNAEAVAAYARSLRRRGLSAKTCKLYLDTARRFVHSLGRRSLRRTTRRHVESFLAARARTLSPSTHADEARRLRRFLVTLLAEGLISKNPAEKVEIPLAHHRAPLLLSEDAVGKLLTAASVVSRDHRRGGRSVALRNRALVELAYGLGLRGSEVTAIRAVDLNLREATLLVRRAKNGGQAVLPLPPSVVPHLRAYLKDGRPALVAKGGRRDQGRLLLTNAGRPICPSHLGEYVRRVADRAGLDAHPHALRRALATHLVRAGASIVVVQDLLGHARLGTTARYVAVDRDDLRRAVAILDRSPGGTPTA